MANPTISQIAINGTTYDACDSQARADIKTLQDSVLYKSGGTITGNLQVNGTLKGYTWDLSTNNTTDTWVPVLNGSTLQHRVIPKNIGTAITGITRSGTTFTATKADGNTFTFTQQDNNTTYSNATTSANGLMSASDKTKLDKISLQSSIKTISFEADSSSALAIVVTTTNNQQFRIYFGNTGIWYSHKATSASNWTDYFTNH